MRVLNRSQMLEADRRTIEDLGVPATVLMERAGREVAAAIASMTGGVAGLRISVLSGRGHNGGDGFVAARALAEAGARPRVYLTVEPDRLQGAPRAMCDLWRGAGGAVCAVATDAAWHAAKAEALDADVVVDALTGTGLVAPAEGLVARMIEHVNASTRTVVAIDLPSGLSADSHAPIGPAVRATMTVTLGAPKMPLVLPPADAFAGDLVVADIGIPAAVIESLSGPRIAWVTAAELRPLMRRRRADSNKGDYGRIAIVAGSSGKTGAAALAGVAALRAGAGLVTVATPASCQAVVAGFAPEYMTDALPETAGMLDAEAALDRVLTPGLDAVAAGPGLGANAATRQLVLGLIGRLDAPLVLDADALNAIARDASPFAARGGRLTVVTPHPGEMARLVGVDVPAVQADRLEVARRYAAAHGVIVVLKGRRTVIAAPDGDVRINSTGNPGMATAGTGDVLTGMIAATLCRGLDPLDAVTLAVFLHGLAGDLAADAVGESSLIATDLVNRIGAADRALGSGDSPRGGRA